MHGDLTWVLALRTDALTLFFKLFPYLASYYFFLITLALGYWTSSKHKLFWLDLGFMITLSAILNRILKEIFAIARPSVERLVEVNDASYSFPSGDAQVLAVFWLMLAYHFRHRIIWLLAIVMIILVSASRVYLGAHFPVDVIVGSIIGCLCFLAYINFGKNNLSALIKSTNSILQLAAISSLCILYYLILQKHFAKIDIIAISTLLGSWLGYLVLPKYLCRRSLTFKSVLAGGLLTSILILTLKQVLISFPKLQLLELACYFVLAFFFTCLVPIFTTLDIKRYS